MRRGIGVAHVQNKKETQRQMTDLGAQITAERVGQIADELESLKDHLRILAQKHKEEIKHDPVARARFRQLAESLDVDLISSKKNVFAGMLGLGDFYYGLASRVVEVCIKERKFCGSYVPLQRIVQLMKKRYTSDGKGGNRNDITEGDVCMALDKLHVLGDGYNVVKLGGVKYIQTTPDGSRSADDVPLLDSVLSKRAEAVAAYRASNAKNEPRSKGGVVSATRVGAGIIPWYRGAAPGADASESDHESDYSNVPLDVQCVALTQWQLEERLMWRPHRVQAVLERMVQNGSVWVEKPAKWGTAMLTGDDDSLAWGSAMTATEVREGEMVYWFIALVLQDDGAL
ncbi:ESCRT-II complex subunit VPS22 [Trypanosoma grayi]|uniref:ESCRT-II complex subunit VPS22 n=1 Tax=Trypanosoma grayi TaxID=71804 RepID=UPI0004F422C8|nr:ESCRT-II complex subunit VPS22 [Trypanosoma grayi]KEG13025.1 ESCRT-II complex subunit VPS22 [Trypanosoma grayi]